MVYFRFPPEIQQGIASGIYEIVRTNTGTLIGLARDVNTGGFVGHAIETVVNNGLNIKSLVDIHDIIISLFPPIQLINPLSLPIQMISSGLEMYQIHRGFTATLKGIEAIKASLGVLQTTTAVIGLGVGANIGLSSLNLWQTLKLREDVKHLKLEMKDGFIDLKQALHSQGREIIQYLDQVTQDIKFEQHRLELVKAYGRFLEASKSITVAVSCYDENIRNADLANARQTLNESLAIYKESYISSEMSAAGQLRRFECAWAIEYTIALTYQLQNQLKAAKESLSHLENTVHNHCLKVIDKINSPEELSFIFPEITHIINHDLVALESWKDHLDWAASLSEAEKESLAVLETNNNPKSPLELTKPTAMIEYEHLEENSHFASLKDKLKFYFLPRLRTEYEDYIRKFSQEKNYFSLTEKNLQEASDLTVTNLYWYFKEINS